MAKMTRRAFLNLCAWAYVGAQLAANGWLKLVGADTPEVGRASFPLAFPLAFGGDAGARATETTSVYLPLVEVGK